MQAAQVSWQLQLDVHPVARAVTQSDSSETVFSEKATICCQWLLSIGADTWNCPLQWPQPLLGSNLLGSMMTPPTSAALLATLLASLFFLVSALKPSNDLFYILRWAPWWRSAWSLRSSSSGLTCSPGSNSYHSQNIYQAWFASVIIENLINIVVSCIRVVKNSGEGVKFVNQNICLKPV